MSDRLCVCGCGKPTAAGSKYADRERCRHTVYRRKLAEAQQQAGIPQRLNLTTLTVASPSRVSDAPAPARKPTARKPDLRINYRRAVEAVANVTGNAHSAEECLKPLLSPQARRALADTGS